MSVGTLTRYTPISGPRVPARVSHIGRDKFGPVLVLQVTSRPTGSRYRKGDVIVVSADSSALAVR